MKLEELYAGTTSDDVNMRLRGACVGVRDPATGAVTKTAVVERAAWADGRIVLLTTEGNLGSDQVALWPDAPLGFVNGQKTAYLVARIPGRQNSAGMSANTVTVHVATGGRVDVSAVHIRSAFIRQYPPGWQAFCKMVKDRSVEAQAISPQFAIVRQADDLSLVYLGVQVGTLARKGAGLVIKSKYPDTIKSKWEELCALLKQ